MTTNPWVNHVRAFHQANPQLTYKECMKEARPSYRKGQSGAGIEALIDPIKEFGETLFTGIIGSPELQQQRTEARIERRAAKDAEKIRKRKERESRRRR